MATRRMSDYEEDHLIPLDLGGAPDDARNLWPQPRVSADGWNADLKDELESVLARLVCSGRVPLAEAQQAIATDWIAAFRRYVTGGTMMTDAISAEAFVTNTFGIAKQLGYLLERTNRGLRQIDFGHKKLHENHIRQLYILTFFARVRISPR
jgi:hypothetical protein